MIEEQEEKQRIGEKVIDEKEGKEALRGVRTNIRGLGLQDWLKKKIKSKFQR